MKYDIKSGLKLALISSDAEITCCPKTNHFYEPELDDERAVLADGCEILAASSALSFLVIAFGERWPVDVETDLVTILEQLPETLSALREGRPAILDFYEQGIERALLFSHGDEESVELKCESHHQEWNSRELKSSLIRGEVIAMLQKLGGDFVDVLGQHCIELVRHPWLITWQSKLE